MEKYNGWTNKEAEYVAKHPTKTCSRCKLDLPRSEFSPRRTRSKLEWAAMCRSCDRKRCRDMRKRNREDLLKYYSNGTMACILCGFSQFDCLDLDHINGGGRADRASVNTPLAFYKRLKDQGYPDGFRVLCKNCNWLEYLKSMRSNYLP